MHPRVSEWGTHGNVTQAAADAAGSYAAAARLQAQQNFSLAEWTSLPDGFLTSNLQTLFSNPGARRLLAEGQLEQLRALATQRGVALTPEHRPVSRRIRCLAGPLQTTG